jgi:hypothetical protein
MNYVQFSYKVSVVMVKPLLWEISGKCASNWFAVQFLMFLVCARWREDSVRGRDITMNSDNGSRRKGSGNMDTK